MRDNILYGDSMFTAGVCPSQSRKQIVHRQQSLGTKPEGVRETVVQFLLNAVPPILSQGPRHDLAAEAVGNIGLMLVLNAG